MTASALEAGALNHWHLYTPNLQKALLAAEQQARNLRSPAIEPAHLMLGLLDTEGCTAIGLLHALGIDADALRGTLTAQLSDEQAALPQAHDPGAILLSARSERVLQSTYIEASKACARRGRPFTEGTPVGTEHLLLGITSPSSTAQIAQLRTHGVFYAAVSEQARRLEDQAARQA